MPPSPDILTRKVADAAAFAAEAHRGQVDKLGEPYILHPMAVANDLRFAPDTTDRVRNGTRVVALLHDVLEDTSTKLGDLQAANLVGGQMHTGVMGDAMQEALLALTKPKGANYHDYIADLCRIDNPHALNIALRVKAADLRHNSMESRLRRIDDTATRKRLRNKYRDAADMVRAAMVRSHVRG